MAAIATRLRLEWNPQANCWGLDILDGNSVPIVQGLALVCGSDLLEQYEYLGLGGQLLAQTDHATDTPPTYENLGAGGAGHLYFLQTPVK